MRTCLLLTALAFCSGAAARPASVEARIRAVGNGLITYVPVSGFRPWSLEARMRPYKVPGLSIAFIHHYRID